MLKEAQFKLLHHEQIVSWRNLYRDFVIPVKKTNLTVWQGSGTANLRERQIKSKYMLPKKIPEAGAGGNTIIELNYSLALEPDCLSGF